MLHLKCIGIYHDVDWRFLSLQAICLLLLYIVAIVVVAIVVVAIAS